MSTPDSTTTPGSTITPGSPFGGLELDPRVTPLNIAAGVGTLTALHSAPVGERRGTVLFVPGFTGSREDFRTFLPLLAERGWDAWVYSQRGQADSVGPEGVENYTLDLFAADAVEVARIVAAETGVATVHLVGHSFGGCVARAAAILDPSAFASLTLLCSGPHGWPGRHQDTEFAVQEGGSIGLWYRDNPHTLGMPDEDMDPEMAFLRHRAAATSSDNLISGARILRNDPDTTPELAATGLPVLVAHGEHDDKWPIPMQRESALRLGADYAVIPVGAHSPQFEAPEATALALDAFWADH
ncbi:alpha/beta fold hydrolase [Mycetocola saprophilus]|uniref:alpha/beta fold hydrolase n=1 Tax=Mycetocola saprophilus TaxID=76636 RepID=UPI00068CD152|nr:alpha/beta hydrolase [Mycetocola saprophilus]